MCVLLVCCLCVHAVKKTCCFVAQCCVDCVDVGLRVVVLCVCLFVCRCSVIVWSVDVFSFLCVS